MISPIGDGCGTARAEGTNGTPTSAAQRHDVTGARLGVLIGAAESPSCREPDDVNLTPGASDAVVSGSGRPGAGLATLSAGKSSSYSDRDQRSSVGSVCGQVVVTGPP